jgi:hypothetical protein
MLGFGLIKDVISLVVFLLVFSGGIKFNEKWPNAASKITGVWDLVEDMFTWLYGIYKSLHPTTTTTAS